MGQLSSSPTHARLGVLGFACSLSLIVYLDRICIMRVQEDMRTDLGFSGVQMGWVFGAFALGYCLCEVPGGWMGDVWGTRRVITRIVLWWSLFTALTGSVDSLLGFWVGPELLTPFVVLYSLLAVRFLFGCGEAGAFPNLTRVIGSWFPFRERALAQGTVWMCARLGGAVAPVVTGRLAALVGWRAAFWVLGGIGAVWCVGFAAWFRNRPEDQPACNEAERELIRAGPYSWKADEAGKAHPWPPWGQLFSSLTLWCLCLTSACVTFAWYFYITWQPQYFKDVHDQSFADSELVTGLPLLCGAAGALLGGGLSDHLIRLTGSRRWGRSLIGLVGFLGAGTCMLAAGLASSAGEAAFYFCLGSFLNDLAIPPIWAVCADVGGRYAGTVAGIMNMAGGIGSVGAPVLTPYVLAGLPEYLSPRQKWLWVFAGLSAAMLVAALAWLGIDAARPLVREDQSAV